MSRRFVYPLGVCCVALLYALFAMRHWASVVAFIASPNIGVLDTATPLACYPDEGEPGTERRERLNEANLFHVFSKALKR